MTAEIIPFPGHRARPAGLSAVAAAILTDMRKRAMGAPDGVVSHSVNDGIRCSGAVGHRVVKARRELEERGLAVKERPGDGYGPAIWRLCQTALEPDGAA